MFTEFTNNLLRELIKEGFVINSRDGGIITDDTKTVVSERRVGGAVCVLAVMNVECLSVAELNDMVENMTKKLEARYGEYFNTVYAVFVLAGEDINDDVKEIIKAGEAFERQKVYSVYWGVSLSDFTVHTNENQPSEMYEIRSSMDRCLVALKCSDDINTSDDAVSIADFQESARLIEIKSNNFAVTFVLIAINIAIFVIMIALGASEIFWEEGAIIPYAVWEYGEFYRLFTATFLHANLTHLASNCLGLYIFGSRVEKYFGKANFLITYFASGLLCSIFSLLFTQAASVGASGAVYGLVGAIAVKSFAVRRELDGVSAYIIVIWILAGFVMSAMIPGIDVFGHIGGLLGGLAVGYVLAREKKTA